MDEKDIKEFYKLPPNKQQDIVIELRKTHTLEKIGDMFNYTKERIRQMSNRIYSSRDVFDSGLSERTKRSLDKNGIHSLDDLSRYKIGELGLKNGIGRKGLKEIKKLLETF